MRWLIYSFILRYPTAALCILALLLVFVFSKMIGWPAYVFLGICVLLFILNLFIGRNSKKLVNTSFSVLELDDIERKNRWIMGLLSIFALSGIVISMHLTMSSLEYAENSTTIIGTMALFHFTFIGIPYILMNMIKRKSSFWYGLMFSVLLVAIIQFLLCSMIVESNGELITRNTTGGFDRIHGNWLIVCPLLYVPIFMAFDSWGKAFGTLIKDETWNMGYDKEKHQLSIVQNKKLSVIGMTISLVWSIFSLLYCYLYLSRFCSRIELI